MTSTPLKTNQDLDAGRLREAFGVFPSGVVAVASEVDGQLAGPVEHRFDGLAVTATGDGSVTLDDGLAMFDCSVCREVEAGDHTIVLLQLHAIQHADTAQPLVFHRSAFGRLAG